MHKVRKRLTRAAIAGALAVVVTAPIGAQPAQAAIPPLAATKLVVDVGIRLVKLWSSYSSGSLSLADATEQIVAAVDTAKNEIISHTEAIATAQVRACATRHVIELADIDHFNPDVLQTWAQDATACVTLADSLLATLTTKPAIDMAGVALGIVGPVALIARQRAGFSTAGLSTVLAHAHQIVVTKLVPTCRTSSSQEPGFPIVTVNYRCTQYNGDTASGMETYVNGELIGSRVSVTKLRLTAGARSAYTGSVRALSAL
ncbi:MAG: hypothetical protein HKP61_18220 [Dactylosporangium sp.]|nr:hypothetical protein [Dactylosporangium sp.]NNJ62833.1 hypothetical protein [Dactylosporangium sp.]